MLCKHHRCGFKSEAEDWWWLIRWYPKVGGDELWRSGYTHVQLNLGKSLKMIVFVVFLSWVTENCKSALSEKMDNTALLFVRYLLLKGSSKKVNKDMQATLGEEESS